MIYLLLVSIPLVFIVLVQEKNVFIKWIAGLCMVCIYLILIITIVGG